MEPSHPATHSSNGDASVPLVQAAHRVQIWLFGSTSRLVSTISVPRGSQFGAYMLVVVSVSRLDNGKVAIRVTRPQHHSNPAQVYPSARQVRAVLSNFGISEETADSHLKLLDEMSANELLKFPTMHVPQHDLLSNGFRL